MTSYLNLLHFNSLKLKKKPFSLFFKQIILELVAYNNNLSFPKGFCFHRVYFILLASLYSWIFGHINLFKKYIFCIALICFLTICLLLWKRIHIYFYRMSLRRSPIMLKVVINKLFSPFVKKERKILLSHIVQRKTYF